MLTLAIADICGPELLGTQQPMVVVSSTQVV